MLTPAQRFRHEVPRFFLPGAVYTFVGAGGKSTAMRCVASLLAETGLKARMTTTTRVGTEEFPGCPVCLVQDASDVLRAVEQEDPIVLLAGAVLEGLGKYAGIDPLLIDALAPRADTVLLVEGDGSRRLPMKVPRAREPVIPSSSRAVLAFMGASAFDEPVDERHCYNHEGALALLGRTGSFFEPDEIAALAAHQDGCRKGVLPGMRFLVFVNQGDLDDKQETAREALRLMKTRHGIDGVMGSFQEGELYAATQD
jgi:probable selenium-dependent hydroxylase accessory protein YqeC